VLTLHDRADVDHSNVAPARSAAASAMRCWRHAKRLRPRAFTYGRFSATLPRAFTSHAAFVAQRKFTDAPTNMEREADVLYEWTP